MKIPLSIPLLAAALLSAIAASTSRADLTHAWNSASEQPAAVDTSATGSADSSDSPESIESADGSAPDSLDSQIADLLDDESLAASTSPSLDLSSVTVSLTEQELLLDRLAVEVASDAESPSTPDASAPIGASDTPFATGTGRIASRGSSSFAVQGVSSPDDSPSFSASDKAANYGGEWSIGDNLGSGFDGWRQIASADLPSRSVNDTAGFAIYAQSGVGAEAIGRSFDGGIALESGNFQVSATHGSTEHFSGFALYSAGDAEILRWGLTTAENTETGGDSKGFWYFRDGQSTFIRTVDASASVAADYSVSWSLLSSGMVIDLSITSGGDTDTLHLTLGNSSAVTAIAALVAGSDPKDTLHFDNLEVTGRAVPEPSTLLLLLSGALAILPRRLRRR